MNKAVKVKGKILNSILIILFTIITFQISAQNNTKYIKVGVFDKYGICPYCVLDIIESLKIDSGIKAKRVSAAEIMNGALDSLDVFIFPGGSGRIELANLGEQGQQRIIDFVKIQGKAVIGICAGAYALTETPNYPSLSLSAGEAIDIEHDNRGHGLVKFSLTELGKDYFPELKDREISYMQYYEGPVLQPAKKSKYKYNELAIMKSDVHTVKTAPAGMTMNRPFIIITQVERGKTASIVGHPECTAGMRWMVPRMVRVVSNNELISYKKHIVKPELYKQEILFTSEQIAKMKEAQNNLLKSKEEKLKAMRDIVDMSAWLGKRWIPPMIRDKDFEVRLLAAKLIVELERTEAIIDIEAAIENEEEPNNKVLLQEQLLLLKNIIGE